MLLYSDLFSNPLLYSFGSFMGHLNHITDFKCRICPNVVLKINLKLIYFNLHFCTKSKISIFVLLY